MSFVLEPGITKNLVPSPAEKCLTWKIKKIFVAYVEISQLGYSSD